MKYSIMYKSGEYKQYKHFCNFAKKVLSTPKQNILYIGWSDGFNACGFSTREWKTHKEGIEKVRQFSKRPFREIALAKERVQYEAAKRWRII